MKRIFLLLTAFTIILSSCCNQQGADVGERQIEPQDAPCLENNFSRPAGAVFNDVAKIFGVTIKNVKRVKDIMIPEADYLIYPWSVDETMEALCYRIGSISYKLGPDCFEIREHNHARTSPEQGKKFLDYLSSQYSDKQEWESRRDTLRREFAKHLGFETLPHSTSVILSGRREYEDIYIENIALEVLPGVYCTGSFYHPKHYSKGGCPIFLNPLGHFADGRFGDISQMLCQMMAKMGCVAIAYDMFGWPGSDQSIQYCVEGDSKEVHTHAVAQNIQLLYGLCALDYLCSLEEADLSRVAVCGASGGGSQTMFITALDDRVTMSIPVVMTSCYMNGGCACESGNGVHKICGRTCNTEIAALAAPRPMLLVSDGGDWTDHCPDFDMPYMKKIYGFYGCSEEVENFHILGEKHGFEYSKRVPVYEFVSRKWGLCTDAVKGAEGTFDESCCVMEDVSIMLNWGPQGQNLPSDAVKTVEQVKAAWNSR